VLGLLLLLVLGKLDHGEPFIRQGWDKTLIIKVGFKMIEGEEVRRLELPKHWQALFLNRSS
jgi:hypothetical protein